MARSCLLGAALQWNGVIEQEHKRRSAEDRKSRQSELDRLLMLNEPGLDALQPLLPTIEIPVVRVHAACVKDYTDAVFADLQRCSFARSNARVGQRRR